MKIVYFRPGFNDTRVYRQFKTDAKIDENCAFSTRLELWNYRGLMNQEKTQTATSIDNSRLENEAFL